MKQKLFSALLLIACVFAISHTGSAQCGGKAEPLKIEFKRGAHSSTLKGKLRGDEQAEYTFAARAGQRITISIASVPSQAISFELHGVDGSAYQVESGETRWTGVLPDTGDYLLYVKIGGAKARRASYTLTLAIK